MRELNSIEEKILDSTLYLMGTMGTMKVPIRAIAKEAGVNVSAINYYFGTKEELLRHTKEFFIINTKAIFCVMEYYEYSAEERLVLFANEIMEYTMRYSGLGVVIKEAYKLKEIDPISKAVIDVSLSLRNKMHKILDQILGGDSRRSEYNLNIFMSAIIFPIDKSYMLYNERCIFTSKEKRCDYIRCLISCLKA